MKANWYNVIERGFWAGVNAGLAILSADGFGWLQAEPWAVMATAAAATVISAIKTISQERLAALNAALQES